MKELLHDIKLERIFKKLLNGIVKKEFKGGDDYEIYDRCLFFTSDGYKYVKILYYNIEKTIHVKYDVNVHRKLLKYFKLENHIVYFLLL